MENSSHDLRTISCSMSQMIVTSPIEEAILSSMLQECFYPKGKPEMRTMFNIKIPEG